MGPVRIGVGTEWLLDGRAWRVVRQLAAARYIAQDTKFLVEQEFSQTEILAHYTEGRLRFGAADSTSSAPQSSAFGCWCPSVDEAPRPGGIAKSPREA